MIVKNNYLSSFIILHHRAVCIEYGSYQKNSLKSVCIHPSTSCLRLQLTLLIISHLLHCWTTILCTNIKKQFRIGQRFDFFTEVADGISVPSTFLQIFGVPYHQLKNNFREMSTLCITG